MRPSILYPATIDKQSPITRGYREIAKRIDYDVYAFSTGNSEFTLEGINIINGSTSVTGKAQDYMTQNIKNYDIIHTGITDPFTLSILPRIILGNTKLIYTAHNCEEMSPNPERYLRLHRTLMTKYCSEVTVPSPFIKKSVKLRYDREATVIPNGVDQNIFHPKQRETDSNVVLCVGRIVPRKNIDFILDLASSLPDLKFKIRGDPSGSYGDKVINKAEIVDNVEIIPRLSVSSLAKLYAQAGVMLAPFEREGFGMSIIEAMASGTPAIGYNDGNLPNLIKNHQNGYLINEISINKWVKKIQSIENNLEPRQTVKQYSWDIVAEMYESTYDNLVENGV